MKNQKIVWYAVQVNDKFVTFDANGQYILEEGLTAQEAAWFSPSVVSSVMDFFESQDPTRVRVIVDSDY